MNQLSSEEVSFILSSNSSLEVLKRTNLVCLEKNLSSPVLVETRLFTKASTFIYSYPAELIFVVLTLGIVCLSIYSLTSNSDLEGVAPRGAVLDNAPPSS